MSKPKKLYKYEAFSVQSLKNLQSRTLYFGSPLNFNDPYDCAIRAKISEPTSSEIKVLQEFLYKDAETPDITLGALKNSNNDNFNTLIKNLSDHRVRSYINRNMKNIGVTCFSECNDDHLMWSHYADKQTGFCLEFDTSQKMFSQVRKVEYPDTYPEINAVNLLVHQKYGTCIDHLYIKSESWEYEKEWRCIHPVAGTCCKYELNALTGIYFGPEISKDVLDIICLIIREQHPNAKLWKGKRSQETFSIKFDLIE
ncbi:DUF2971 domain-containing protein [Shewanella sp. 1_MG-2023]|uniref:DUF2971 domain-containing protein n=1 Tax=unclassified Shewanella TaxID=196818 RepID=UPI0026E21E77|nr:MULTISPECIES: DUF2971 domain-containing protein [unclassified Shewanella]MDO6612633.1 DUF2971 domain-containing protein [Shewanella sp. 7_MG-2023]MDO6772332.1 DUF2971 domain-containing protein [Shewanella sp. 2_MG-2023]MDO6795315.1 DUF2971 domain-containing protein [Shewanella sp. 1_MG-2023]